MSNIQFYTYIFDRFTCYRINFCIPLFYGSFFFLSSMVGESFYEPHFVREWKQIIFIHFD